MKTEIIRIDINNIDTDKLKYAAEIIKAGGLVAFPTETVYGLGADALNESAVEKIFKAKGRPSDNPLIVHISDRSQLGRLVKTIPQNTEKLIDRFWPGPLTLVMEKSDIVPSIISAGLDTVAIRMPSHPVAVMLIKMSGVPVAAPSANISGKPSPTTAMHVIDDLYGKIDAVIDAGDTNLGLESTVLDLTSVPPVILRPGCITSEDLKKVIHKIGIDRTVDSINRTVDSIKRTDISKEHANIIPRSPGVKYKHYSPDASVIIVEGEIPKIVAKICEMAAEYQSRGIEPGILATEQTKDLYGFKEVYCMGDRDHPGSIAANLFKILRELDEKHIRVVFAEAVDEKGIGLAVMNRMTRAAGYNIIKV